MIFFNFGPINRRLTLLVLFSVLPAMAILLYTDIDQRHDLIKDAQKDVSMLARAMAVKQQDTILSGKQVLSTLAAIPEIQDMNIQRSREVLATTLMYHPQYNNMLLINLKGVVIASGKPFTGANQADRKHFKEAANLKKFAVGEFTTSGVGDLPVFPFAYPVLDKSGRPKAILATFISLADFSTLHDVSKLPEKSFLAVTDHRGIRLYYYPPQQASNPIGKPIKAKSWQIVDKKREPGIFTSEGSDGLNKIFAFEPLRLAENGEPYMYVWAGAPEALIVAHANEVLVRNLIFMILSVLLAIFILRVIGERTIIAPIHALVDLAENYGMGNFEARSKYEKQSGDFGSLTRAFHNMAQTIHRNQKTLKENEARFRHLMNSLDALVYVADMDTYQVLFVNDYGKNLLGDITGKICWQCIQQGQDGPCDFCTNKYLIDENGKPKDVYTWEFQNTLTGKWFHIRDRAIHWPDGRLVRLEIATDITERKENELAKDALIEKLEKAFSEIKRLRGILPICSFCKKIRDDKGYWNQVEVYVKEHSEADFSHSLCPDCAKNHYPEYFTENGKIKAK